MTALEHNLFLCSLWPILGFALVHQTWVLSLCSSFPLLLGALLNGACHCFIIFFFPFSIGFMLKVFTCLGPFVFSCFLDLPGTLFATFCNLPWLLASLAAVGGFVRFALFNFTVNRSFTCEATQQHRWSSGRIVPCHGTDPGSIPGRCNFYWNWESAKVFFYACHGLFVCCVFYSPLHYLFCVFGLFDPPNNNPLKNANLRSEENKPILHTLCSSSSLLSHYTRSSHSGFAFHFFIWQALSSRIFQGLSYNTRWKISSTLQTVLLSTFFFLLFQHFLIFQRFLHPLTSSSSSHGAQPVRKKRAELLNYRKMRENDWHWWGVTN